MRSINQQRGNTRIIILIVVIIAIAGSALFFFSRQEPTAADAGNDFTAALVAQDAAMSYGMLAEDFRANFSEQSWQEWVSVIFDQYQARSAELLTAVPVENLGNVYAPEEQPTRLTYEFEFDNGTYTLTVILIMESGTWKVSEIGSFE